MPAWSGAGAFRRARSTGQGASAAPSSQQSQTRWQMVGGGHGVPVVQRSTGNDLLRAMGPRVVSHFPLCFQVREGSPLPGVSTSKSIRTVSIKHKRLPWSITRKAQMISLAAKESARFPPLAEFSFLASPATTLRMYTSASHVVARRFSHGGRNCLAKVRRQRQRWRHSLGKLRRRPFCFILRE